MKLSRRKIIIIFILFSLLFYRYSPNISHFKDQDNIAVIVEPRIMKELLYVIYNLHNKLPKWRIQVFCGILNYDYIKKSKIYNLLNKKGLIYITKLNVDNLTPVLYSDLLKTKKFWNEIRGGNILIFQTDSCICNSKINNFLKYDYVGAPWKYGWSYGGSVGNGGLSFRKKNKMLEIIDKCKSNKIEDVYFSFGCPGVNIKKPSFNEGKQFSVESEYYHKPFAVHAAWKYLEPWQLKKISKNCKCIDKIN